jgi:hypothetical protein
MWDCVRTPTDTPLYSSRVDLFGALTIRRRNTFRAAGREQPTLGASFLAASNVISQRVEVVKR